MQNFKPKFPNYFSELTDLDAIQKLVPSRLVQKGIRFTLAGLRIEVVTGDPVIRRFI